MSQFGSSIGDKKRIILKNLDGSYTHCYKTGEKDSTQDNKILSDQISNYNQNENLTISDSELQYIIDNYEQFDHTNIMEQLLNVFRRNQFIFLVLLIMEMSLTFFLLFITWKKKETSILMLQEIYKDLNAKEASILFYGIFVLSFILNSFFYPMGFYALISKKVNIFKFFSVYSLYTATLTILIIYINILFIVLFIVRLIIYGFSRFIINLLISILVLPRYNNAPNNIAPNNIPQNNNQNYQSI